MNHWWFVPLGLGVGCIGTLIGAGGGFILMPILLLLYPNESPERLTALSLAVVALNALSGTVAYVRMRRVQYRAGLLFAAAALPGSFIGIWVNGIVPRHTFDVVMGVALVLFALYLIRRSLQAHAATHTDVTGTDFAYAPAPGVAISAVVGFLSSLLGIGGGIVHVPALVYVLGFPAHIATATSHFVLAITALAATIVHAASGHLDGNWTATLQLGVGVIVGAQAGARLSSRIGGVWIIRCLSAALLLVGGRVMLKAF